MTETTNQDSSSKREIWVLAEKQGERWDSVTLELLQDAQVLAKRAKMDIVAVVFSKPGAADDAKLQELAANGANEIIVLENDAFSQPNGPLTYANVLLDVIGQRPMQMLLCPSTPLWVECASAVVTEKNGAIVSNVISFRYQPEKGLEVTRYAWGNKVQMSMILSEDQPWVVCLRPNVAGVGKTNPQQKATIVRQQVSQVENENVQIEELLSPDPRELDLAEADRILAGGRGIGEDGFGLLEELALIIEAGVGATRVAVDNGWIPYSRQIGQTGKIVKPRLYIAAGISGAAQHVDGMKESETIIVINKDANATIYDLADLSVVGDANEIIKELTKQLGARIESAEEAI